MVIGDRQKTHTRALACVRVLMGAGGWGGGYARAPVAHRNGCVGGVGWVTGGLGGCQPLLERWAPSFRAMNLDSESPFLWTWRARSSLRGVVHRRCLFSTECPPIATLQSSPSNLFGNRRVRWFWIAGRLLVTGDCVCCAAGPQVTLQDQFDSKVLNDDGTLSERFVIYEEFIATLECWRINSSLLGFFSSAPLQYPRS